MTSGNLLALGPDRAKAARVSRISREEDLAGAQTPEASQRDLRSSTVGGVDGRRRISDHTERGHGPIYKRIRNHRGLRTSCGELTAKQFIRPR